MLKRNSLLDPFFIAKNKRNPEYMFLSYIRYLRYIRVYGSSLMNCSPAL